MSVQYLKMRDQFIKIEKHIYNVKHIISISPDEAPTCLQVSTKDGTDYIEFDSERKRDTAIDRISLALDTSNP